MSGKHLCQLRDREKLEFLRELREIAHRFDSLETGAQDKYPLDNLPNFLKGRLPKFKPNTELRPMITHNPVKEVHFTSDVEAAKNTSNNADVAYAFIPGSHNPFNPTYKSTDRLCQEYCDSLATKTTAEPKPICCPKPVCLKREWGGPPKDKQGNFYDCEYNSNNEGVMVCNPSGGTQNYLCTNVARYGK